jgi:hypothetical protein
VSGETNTRSLPALCLGVVAVAAFFIMSSDNLEKQGLFYDEVHQGPAAFLYLGKQPHMFVSQVRGFPVLNLSYSGAIKSNLYGLYLRYINPYFSVYSWRLCGIALVAVGIFAFYQIAGQVLPFGAASLFGFLFITDASIILASRHDWGPVALACAFRLMFVAIWLSIELSSPSASKYFTVGFVAGIAIFEKLSSIVLLAPLGLLLLTTISRRRMLGGVACVVGLTVGSVPLILANAATFMRGTGFVSTLALEEAKRPLSLNGFAEFTYQYLALGQGGLARTWILGDVANPFLVKTEVILLASLLVLVSVAGLRFRHLCRFIAPSMLFLACYIGVGIFLFLLPRDTFVHHWVLGTPFQYASIAMLFAASDNLSRNGAKDAGLYKLSFHTALSVLLAVRFVSIAGLEASLASGRASLRFDPSFTRLAEAAARRSQEAIFIAADWGTATQIYCMSNGQEDLVYEPYWSGNPAEVTRTIAHLTPKSSLYIVFSGAARSSPWSSVVDPRATEISKGILSSMTDASDWREVAAESEFRDLGPIQVRKFVRGTD